MSTGQLTTDMREYPKEIALRDGSRVMLRPCTQGDTDILFDFFKALTDRDRRYFKHDVNRRQTIAGWCEDLNYDKVLPLLAVADDGAAAQVVANGTLHTEEHGWSTHVARIRLQVRPSHRRRGLGQAMVRELCDRAHLRGIDKIQAHLRADNERGLRLMRKIGFVDEGVFKKHAVDKRGRRHDIIVLYQDLEDLWRLMEEMNLELDTPSFFP